jgi:hypothetical protein
VWGYVCRCVHVWGVSMCGYIGGRVYWMAQVAYLIPIVPFFHAGRVVVLSHLWLSDLDNVWIGLSP